MIIRIVGRLLVEQCANRPVGISDIKPDDVRKFFTSQSELYSVPAGTGTLASALRGYFRYRTVDGVFMLHSWAKAVRPQPGSYYQVWRKSSLC
jgi:hypothetical protein